MPDQKHPHKPLQKLRRIKRALANKTPEGLTPYYRYVNEYQCYKFRRLYKGPEVLHPPYYTKQNIYHSKLSLFNIFAYPFIFKGFL